MTKPGYRLDRDDEGRTELERRVLGAVGRGATPVEIRRVLGMKKQRVHTLLRQLEAKGFIRQDGEGRWVAVTPEEDTDAEG